MNMFAKSLEVIPKIIADNAGMDSLDIINKLRHKHSNFLFYFSPWRRIEYLLRSWHQWRNRKQFLTICLVTGNGKDQRFKGSNIGSLYNSFNWRDRAQPQSRAITATTKDKEIFANCRQKMNDWMKIVLNNCN